MSEGLVDWGLANRIAASMAGTGPELELEGRPFGPRAVASAFDAAAPAVAAYTGLHASGPIPAGESIDRAEWTRAGIANLRDIASRLEARIEEGISLPGPLGGIVRAIAGRAAAAEAGAAVGFAARRVLGQYDIALGESRRDPRLFLVEVNMESTCRELGADPELFLEWVALHEITHALQFGSVPWLGDHLSSLLGELIDSGAGGVDAAALRDLARRLVTSDPRRTVRALLRGEAARMLAGPEQGRLFDRIQAAMALIEGYAEHAMDHASTSRTDELARLRARLEERRQSRTGLGTVIARLLGLEVKMEQYRLGKAFCDAVVAEAGIGALNRAWAEPSALPTLGELETPSDWVARVAAPAHA